MKFWRYIITVLCAISCATLCTILVGCGTDTYEVTDKGFTWRYKGLIDDTTMVVEVEHWEQGTIHCNHFMSYDDGESFTNTLSTYYYPADLRSQKVGKKKSTPEALLPEAPYFEELPRWTESCLAMDSIDGNFYCVNALRLDEYSYACALAIMNSEKQDLDTLEFENCGFDLHKDISFAAHYLKVSDSFYAIQDGMLKSQSPTYRIKNAGDAVIVVNQRGDSLFYEGEP